VRALGKSATALPLVRAQRARAAGQARKPGYGEWHTTLLIGYLCGNLIKYANSPFLVLRTQLEGETSLSQRLSGSSAGQDSEGLKCEGMCQFQGFGIN